MPEQLNELALQANNRIIEMLKTYKTELYKYKRHIFVAIRM
jgi:hypothetical protein